MNRHVVSGIVTTIVVVTAPVAADQTPSTHLAKCQPVEALVKVPELPEGSGLAASRRSPGRLWSHNDSGEPVLVALTSQGQVAGQLRVTGANVDDWEAVAVGPCPAGSCIHVADIGDNDAERRHVVIYRFPEPGEPSETVREVDVFRASYPDGSHDAETLLITPDGDIMIVTKGDTGPVSLYRMPKGAKPGSTVMLEPVGKPRPGKTTADERITDGAVSPTGSWIALRTTTAVVFYRTNELLSGNWRETSRVSLKAFAEPQGEGIAFGDETTIYLVGEGGGKSRAGTFGRLTCAF